MSLTTPVLPSSALGTPLDPGVRPAPTTSADDLVHVRVSGPLTVASAARVRRLIRGYLTLGDVRLLVDLEGVTALDACGIGALLDGLRAVQACEGGEMQLRVNPVVRAALKRSGTVSVFSLRAR